METRQLTPEAPDNTTATEGPVADEDREKIGVLIARRVREVGYLLCQSLGSDRHSGR